MLTVVAAAIGRNYSAGNKADVKSGAVAVVVVVVVVVVRKYSIIELCIRMAMHHHQIHFKQETLYQCLSYLKGEAFLY